MNSVNPTTDRIRGTLLALYRSLRFPTNESMRRWALAAIVVNVGITVTGAAVRVTGSGLGCPTWPRCTPDSFVPARIDTHAPLNMAIEFGNRLLSFLVLAVAAACVIVAWQLSRGERGRPVLLRLALVQPAGVLVQALWGGVVVHTMLNPVTVSVHFLLSIGMTAAAVVLFARAGEGDAPAERLVHRDIRTLAYALSAAAFALLLAGVVVTGTGPHSGDEAASRFGFDIQSVVRLHTDIAYVVVGLTFALLFALRVSDAPGRARRAALVLLGVELSQGVVGYVQYFLAVPAALVLLHVLGATLVWVCALRVVFLMRTRGPAPAPAHEQPELHHAGV
ncbi:heme A synthase [Microbispora rosea]|uniref:COX15/CtaA family protein n=1 Tax=Microbispora rosea TaxID=58117 RepID=UPI00068D96AD|nr:COX15/CtaA family protein [Microbispora rosea]